MTLDGERDIGAEGLIPGFTAIDVSADWPLMSDDHEVSGGAGAILGSDGALILGPIIFSHHEERGSHIIRAVGTEADLVLPPNPVMLLMELEWSGTNDEDTGRACPICTNYRSLGHDPSCRLAAAIGATTHQHRWRGEWSRYAPGVDDEWEFIGCDEVICNGALRRLIGQAGTEEPWT